MIGPSTPRYPCNRWIPPQAAGTLTGMPKSPRKPGPLVGKIFLGGTALRRRLLTAAELRGAAWRPLFRGVYADASMTITHRHRCLAVSRYLLPPTGAIAGRSAATLYGVNTFDATDPVEVAVPRAARFGPVAGLRVHTSDVSPDEIRDLDGVRDHRRAYRLGPRAVARRGRGGRRTGHPGPPPAHHRHGPGGVRPRPGRSPGLATPVARGDAGGPGRRVAAGEPAPADWIVLHVTARRLRDDFEGFLAELRAALRLRARQR
ncbi:hypothetical protein WEI85_26310 [Actinomycetes bacterium KLBMP 9797]